MRLSGESLPEAQAFHTTHWSLVAAARGSEEDLRRQAMERLCRTYWLPLYWFVRKKGRSDDDARDLTQGFFAKFVEKNYIEGVQASRGRFRTWLLSAMSHFMMNEYDKARSQKRGGAAKILSLDDTAWDARLADPVDESSTPEAAYDQQWVQALLVRVVQRLKAECQDAGRGEQFEILKTHLTGARGEQRVAESASLLGMTEAATTSLIHRLRQRYGEIFREEVMHTLSDPSELEDEIRYLLSVMGR